MKDGNRIFIKVRTSLKDVLSMGSSEDEKGSGYQFPMAPSSNSTTMKAVFEMSGIAYELPPSYLFFIINKTKEEAIFLGEMKNGDEWEIVPPLELLLDFLSEADWKLTKA